MFLSSAASVMACFAPPVPYFCGEMFHPAAPGQHPHGLLRPQPALEISHGPCGNSPYAFLSLGKAQVLQACAA